MFDSTPNGEYSNLLIAAYFSNKSFSGKIPLPFKTSCFSIFPDDKAEILAVCLFVCFVIDRLAFLWFYNRFSLNLIGLSDG